MVLSQKLTWQPDVKLPYRTSEELERMTRPTSPVEVARAPLSRHRIVDSRLVQEELTFPSAVTLRFPESNLARAYVYRQGAIGARPVLLWVPGQHVGDRDFVALHEFFDRAMARGFDVVCFVPPYHLERTPRGFGSGDAFLSTTFPDHLMAFAQELSDLRRLVAWLRAQGVRELGAFGSSMGGSMVLNLITWEPLFEFVAVMQPLIDWNGLLLRPEMKRVRQRMRAQGLSDEEIATAYQAVDPRASRPLISASRISVLGGRYDLLAPEGILMELAKSWGITRVRTYERGHAFLTLSTGPFRGFSESLEVDAEALGWRRYVEGFDARREVRERRDWPRHGGSSPVRLPRILDSRPAEQLSRE